MYKFNNKKKFFKFVMLEWQIICHFSTKYSISQARYHSSIVVLSVSYICDY